MLIIGCGAIGSEVATHYLAGGERVVGLVRSAASAHRLGALGILPNPVDLDGPTLPDLLAGGSRVFYLAPPPPSGRTDPRMGAVVASFSRYGSPRRIVYISTTGVYGDCRGEWVDETRPAAPIADRARRRLDAEKALRDWSRDTGAELVVLRVAGIYGPGRLPLRRLQQYLPLISEDEAPCTNRIHARDLVRICIAAMEKGKAGEVYNVCDGHPETMTGYFNRVADLVGLPRPPTIPLQGAERRLSAGMMSYMMESRRLSNRKMREQLGVELQYPGLAEGLPACLDEAQR